MRAKLLRWDARNAGDALQSLDCEADWEGVWRDFAGGQTQVFFCAESAWPDPPSDGLSAAECEQAGKFRRETDRKAFVAGRLLMRMVIARVLTLSDDAQLPIETDAKGKPFCPLPGAPFFNLSHTRGWLGLAVRGMGPVGLDLEDTRREVNLLPLTRRYFSEAEAARVAVGGAEAFFRIWTRKEALVKCMGTGLTVSLRGLDTLALEAEGRWRFQEITPAPFLQGCVVTSDGH